MPTYPLPHDRRSLPYYIPSNLPSAPHRSSLSPRPNLLLRRSSLGVAQSPSGGITVSRTALLVGVIIVSVIVFLGILLIIFCIYRRRRKIRNRKLAAYTRGDSRGLLYHAAPPPAITIERPSLNISRPVSDPTQGPTPIFSLRKSTEYTDHPSGILPPEYSRHQQHGQQPTETIEISELPASDVPEFPATPYDPHYSHSRSRSASPPRYSFASDRSDDADPLQPRPLRFSGSSTGSGKNNSYAPLPNPPLLEDHPAYNVNNNASSSNLNSNSNSIPLTAYSTLPPSTTPRSLQSASSPTPQNQQSSYTDSRASKSFSFASNSAEDTLSYPPPSSISDSLSTTSGFYAPTPIEEDRGRGRTRGTGKGGIIESHAEIEIAMGNPLALPDGPFSPGGERAQQAVAARGGRSEWYRSPPGSARGVSAER